MAPPRVDFGNRSHGNSQTGTTTEITRDAIPKMPTIIVGLAGWAAAFPTWLEQQTDAFLFAQRSQEAGSLGLRQ